MSYDAIIIGGALAQAGKKVLIPGPQHFPRFHIGGSFIPCGNDALRARSTTSLPETLEWTGNAASGRGDSTPPAPSIAARPS